MLTEANVEAHNFRLEFAQEVLHAFRAKRRARARDRESCAAAPPQARIVKRRPRLNGGKRGVFNTPVLPARFLDSPRRLEGV